MTHIGHITIKNYGFVMLAFGHSTIKYAGFVMLLVSALVGSHLDFLVECCARLDST